MASIRRTCWLLTLALCCTSCWAASDKHYRDPVFGLILEWGRLDRLQPQALHGETQSPERRILARAPAGYNDMIYIWSQPPRTADAGNYASTDSEADASMLVKSLGNINLSLGPSTGHLAKDYPEMNPRVTEQLLQDYVANLVKYFGSAEALQQALGRELCAGADRMAVVALNRIGVTGVCMP